MKQWNEEDANKLSDAWKKAREAQALSDKLDAAYERGEALKSYWCSTNRHEQCLSAECTCSCHDA